MKLSRCCNLLSRTATVAFLSATILRADAAKPAPPADMEKLIDVLFQAPVVEQVSLSPDGKHLAFTCEIKDHKVMGVYDLQKFTQRLAGLANMADVQSFRWVGSEQLLLGMRGIYVSNLNLDDVRSLPLDHDLNWKFQEGQLQDASRIFLLAYPHGDLYPDLHVALLPSKRVNLLEKNPGDVSAWLLDDAGVARVAVIPGRNLGATFRFRENAGAAWHAEALPGSANPLFFAPDGQSILISHRNQQGRLVVQDYDLRKHQVDGEPLLADSFCDIDPVVIRDNQTGHPIGLAYPTEKPQVLWFDPQYGKLQALIQRSFPGQTVTILGPMPDKRVLFRTHADAIPPALYVLDLAQGKISLLLESMPAAARYAWAPMQPITFPARDGYNLHGYLTLPLHRLAGQAVPLVALSHGGPRARDQWGFEPEVQYLAALGYAVLQVNYRGSTGYGQAHELKNTIEVCERSVDDVVDGINWAVQYGYANPKKIVVYGASYGGYISLAIATRYPSLAVACIGFAGVYDWLDQYKHESSKSYDTLKFLIKSTDYYLDPSVAADRYRAFSPVNFAEKVTCPVLLLHGGADQVVDIAQTKLMANALQQAGKSVEVVRDAQVIHGLPNELERRTFYRKMGEFVLKYAPPGP